ncbi:DUF1292 domain-containing protein [bacterium]|nr:DUF1292 domain-containing protein [bacterium]
MTNERVVINMKSSTGEQIPCEIVDIFEFMECDYALLLKLADESMVIMRMGIKEGKTIFRSIESEEEFNRVVEHVQELAATHGE